LKEPAPKTIDDLHRLNLDGKLDTQQGYLYNGYSFVNYDGIWYTQIMSPKGTRMYDSAFRFGPREAEDVPIIGRLDATLFNRASTYYVTFDPLGSQFNYVAVAVADINQNMMKVFEKTPIAACDKNETEACNERPIIDCSNTKDLVFYIKEKNETRVYIEDNCINIEGSQAEMVRAVDKLLFVLYGISE
ncbi:MAG: hypothetical protein KJ922_01690, partial [Nanoarchaeota archaeon]|nr:hypothetical protein [Nanoarchaeota archaeon]